VSQEITPFLPKSELSEVSRNLPQGIHEKGKEIRVFMPKYGSINERRHQLHEVIRLSGMNLVVDDTDHPLIIKVASIPTARMQVYFIDNEDFFQRKAVLEDKSGKFFKDNDERSIFFCRGVLETVRKLGWAPDIIHCHGWFTSLLPLYVKKFYNDDPHFAESKVVFSAYEDGFDGSLDKNLTKKLKFDGFNDEDIAELKDPTFANLSKLAFRFSDGVVEGSEDLPKEIKSSIENLKDTETLEYCEPSSCVKTYSEFYDKIVEENSVLVE
ncbi:MAG TPA: glycogen/starch synthase, partial [Cryomorphaceae bacterium]|nr:glycogen/starch synthase [Cryomorphaceae bacterium]